MKEHPAGRAMSRNLLWGYYRDGELQTAFALREDGSVMDGKGETISLESFSGETGRIGLVHPEELTETERKFWKKYAGKEKWKQPFPQLKIPACQGQYDLSAFSGIQVTQLFMITAAGKWGLYQGSDKNQYMSYHMADLLHGYGAQLIPGQKMPEPVKNHFVYGDDLRPIFRSSPDAVKDNVPESLICTPRELSARFVSTALAAFRAIIGNSKKE